MSLKSRRFMARRVQLCWIAWAASQRSMILHSGCFPPFLMEAEIRPCTAPRPSSMRSSFFFLRASTDFCRACRIPSVLRGGPQSAVAEPVRGGFGEASLNIAEDIRGACSACLRAQPDDACAIPDQVDFLHDAG